ncbi:acylphosphatase [Bradyrhizobium symbiodeficiens]|uniref:acylphosphatase n=1 Tax=Bradyrhizobium symbiodeficiens TaxID=1404367 RepID=A0ABX5W5P1_9BRAD|nr:acylphosphatase [Bradyrhizobium symbiodeficiens]QDF38591.1 acylphosphatase [Bradyrhizobium symbiodeficiens]
MSRAILQVMICGRVQGVGYRAWVEYQATACGLEGWVRNRRDGCVEALFAGAPKQVADMVALCRHGPPSSRVDSVTSETANADELNLRRAGEAFSVLPTV